MLSSLGNGLAIRSQLDFGDLILRIIYRDFGKIHFLRISSSAFKFTS